MGYDNSNNPTFVKVDNADLKKELKIDFDSLSTGINSDITQFKNQTTAQLAESVNKQPIYLTDYGVSHLNSATVNTPKFQQAVIDAESAGRPIIMPWVPDGSFIEINERIIIATGGIEIKGYGRQTRIRQNLFPKPIFDVLAPNVEIEGFHAEGVTFDATGNNTAFRGNTTLHTYYCAVFVAADNVIVKNIYGKNLSTVVQVTNWDESLKALGARKKGCEVHNIESLDVVFNLLVGGVDGFRFSGIKGHYKLMTGATTPPHLIYFTGSSNENLNIIGDNCYSKNGEYSFAYQFKGVIGGEFNKLLSDNSMGLLHVMHSKNCRFTGLTSLNDPWSDVNIGSIEIESDNSNIEIDGVTLKLTGDGKPVRISAETSKSKLKNAVIESKHNTAGAANTYDVDIRGTSNQIENIEVSNVGTTYRTGSIGIWEGSENTISKPKTSGNERGIVVRSGTGHVVKDYLLADLKHSGSVVGSKPLEVTSSAIVSLLPLNPNAKGIGYSDRLLAYERCDLLSDSVGTAYRTSSGHSWVQSFGSWLFKNNRLYSISGVPALAYITLSTPNVDISAGLKYGNREFLAVRATDKNNMIGVRLNHVTNMAEIYKMDAGVSSVLASSALTPSVGRRYLLNLKVHGSVIDFYVDGRFMATYTLTADELTKYGATNNHGVGGNSHVEGFFDNIEWRSIE